MSDSSPFEMPAVCDGYPGCTCSEHRREPRFSDWETVTHTALCDNDKCQFKYRGVTMLATDEAALKHARESRHVVSVHLDSKKTVTP